LPLSECHREWEFSRNKVHEGSEGLNNCESKKLFEDMDPSYAFHGQNSTTISEQLEKIKKKSRDVSRIARLEMLNSIDEESKENLRKEKCIQYYKRNKVRVAPQTNDSQPPPKLTRNINPTPPSTSRKNDGIQVNVDVTNALAKINVHVPLIELIKICLQMDKVRNFLIPEPEDPPIVLQTIDHHRDNGGIHLSSSPW